MSVLLKTFRTKHAFYAEVIDGDILVGAKWLAIDPNSPIAYDDYLNEAAVAIEEYDGFDLETVSDLPGYVVVTFYKISGNKKHRQRCVLYGPTGYMGEYPTPSAAFEAASVHQDSLKSLKY